MRGIDLDMTGKVWMYRPGSDQGPAGDHKTAYRGHRKVVALGPKSQEIIRRHLKPDVTALPVLAAGRHAGEVGTGPAAAKDEDFPVRVEAAGEPKAQESAAVRRALRRHNLHHRHPPGVYQGRRAPLARRINCGTRRPRKSAGNSALTRRVQCWGIGLRRSPKSMPNWTRARRRR